MPKATSVKKTKLGVDRRATSQVSIANMQQMLTRLNDHVLTLQSMELMPRDKIELRRNEMQIAV